MDDKQTYIFKRQKYGQGSYSTSEHTYICSEDSSWVPILLQFATFLDEAGYVGVYEAVLLALEEGDTE